VSESNVAGCPVCGAEIDTSTTLVSHFENGTFLVFRSPACLKLYRADPGKFKDGPCMVCPAEPTIRARKAEQ
jgi:hypothetical protein